MPDSFDASLLERVKKYDPEAWGQFVTIFSPDVYGWARHFGVPPANAGEIVYDLFDGVSRAIGNFRREHSAEGVRGWLWSIASSKIKRCLRQQVEARVAGDQLEHASAPELPNSPPTIAPDSSTANEEEFRSALARIVEISEASYFGRKRRGRNAVQ
jgi:RNA polymerase sigma-70 factor (ECF subfamily)